MSSVVWSVQVPVNPKELVKLSAAPVQSTSPLTERYAVRFENGLWLVVESQNGDFSSWASIKSDKLTDMSWAEELWTSRLSKVLGFRDVAVLWPWDKPRGWHQNKVSR